MNEKMREESFKIPTTEEEQTEREVEILLNQERDLLIQNYLAPDLTDD